MVDDVQKWDNNYLQFARLLDEIRCLGLSTEQYDTLMEAMDLGYEDIDELFERAALEWHRAKQGMPVREQTHSDELEDWVDGSAV